MELWWHTAATAIPKSKGHSET